VILWWVIYVPAVTLDILLLLFCRRHMERIHTSVVS